jgi:hypothetical protein
VRRGRAHALLRPVLAQERVAAGFPGDEHVASAEIGDLVEPGGEVLGIDELVPHESLRLALVRRDQIGLRLDAEAERLPLGVEYCEELRAGEVADEPAVETGIDPPWERSGQDDEVGPLGQVVELVPQRVQLVLADLGSPLVDLRVRV